MRSAPVVAVRAHAGLLVLVLDLGGTFVFAIEGAMAGVRADFDPFGILVLAICTAIGGGIIRDLLIGATPPAAILDWRYPLVILVAALIVLPLHTEVAALPPGIITVFDAGGLALFCVAGTEKSLERGLHPMVACALGTITAVGGGTIRDLLLNRVPLILHADIYATAALAGAIVMVLARRLGAPAPLAACLGAVLCFTLRVVAAFLGWNLPDI